jgi:hypothetical protein
LFGCFDFASEEKFREKIFYEEKFPGGARTMEEMKTETAMLKLKAAARGCIDLYLSREDGILRVLFFVLMVLIQVLLMIGIARHQADGGVFPISYVFYYVYVAYLLFQYNKTRVPLKEKTM